MKHRSLALFFLCISISCHGQDNSAAPADGLEAQTETEDDSHDPFAGESSAAVGNEPENRKLRFPIPESERKKTGPRLMAGKIRGGVITMTLLNDSDETVYHGGTGHVSPFYNPEIFRDGEWRYAPNHMNCGTGAFLSGLPAGQGFSFQVAVPLAPTPFRVSMKVLGEPDKSGKRKASGVVTQPLDLLPTRIRDADGIVDIAIYEEEWIRLPRTTPPDEAEDAFRETAHPEDYPDDFDPGVSEVVLVKRAVVTRVHKGELKVGEKVEYSDPVMYPSNSPRHYRSGVEGEPRTLFFAKDAFRQEKGRHVMGLEGHYSFSRVKGVMAAAFGRETESNPELRQRGDAPLDKPEVDQTENMQARIRESDFIVDTSIYEQEWTPPVPAGAKGMLLQRAVVVGVHKGAIKVGTLLEYTYPVETWTFPKPFRSGVEGELRTFFFSKDDAFLKDEKYTIKGDAHFGFSLPEHSFAFAFAKELETNPDLRGSDRTRAKEEE